MYQYKCNRPDKTSPKEWEGCKLCKYSRCGYSRCFEPNEKWKSQKGICQYEHCIENMGFSDDEGKSCPVFGHDCPGGKKQADLCNTDKGDAVNSIIKVGK